MFYSLSLANRKVVVDIDPDHCKKFARLNSFCDAKLGDVGILSQVSLLLTDDDLYGFALDLEFDFCHLFCSLILPEAWSFPKAIGCPMHSPAKALRNQT